MTKFFIAGHALIERDNKYLATRRSAIDNYKPLKWDIPGGIVNPGETMEEAIKREVMEETCLQISIEGVIYIHSNLAQLPDKQTCQAIYLCQYVKGNVRLNPKEHDEYAWLSKEEMRKLDSMVFLQSFLEEDII